MQWLEAFLWIAFFVVVVWLVYWGTRDVPPDRGIRRGSVEMSNSAGESSAAEPKDEKRLLLASFGLIGAAVVVFTVCSLVQGAFGTSMFSSSYRDPGAAGFVLVNLTFYPGWFLTISLAGLGIVGLWATRSRA